LLENKGLGDKTQGVLCIFTFVRVLRKTGKAERQAAALDPFFQIRKHEANLAALLVLLQLL